jgi:flavin-binding protein dodecin
MVESSCGIIELAGFSEGSLEAAVKNATAKTLKTILSMKMFRLVDATGQIRKMRYLVGRSL